MTSSSTNLSAAGAVTTSILSCICVQGFMNVCACVRVRVRARVRARILMFLVTTVCQLYQLMFLD